MSANVRRARSFVLAGKLSAKHQLPRAGRRQISSQGAQARTDMHVTVFLCQRMMHRRAATPLFILIHPIVVNQKERLHEFERSAWLGDVPHGLVP